jgi:hypothetical protein
MLLKSGTLITRLRLLNQENLLPTLSKSLVLEETNWLESIAQMVTGIRLLLEMDNILETSMIRESLMFQEEKMKKEQEFNGTNRIKIHVQERSVLQKVAATEDGRDHEGNENE